MVDPTTGIWHIADKDTPEHQFDFSLAVALVEVLKFFQVKSVADLGCGLGTYCEFFRSAGFNPVMGFDGNPHTAKLTDDWCEVLDLSEPVCLGWFDAILSIEVGEHIPAEREQIFIDNLTNSTDNVLILSWAVPGQGGLGHVNCRENEYIIEQIEKRGFIHHPDFSTRLREIAELSWFKHTIMVFNKKSE